jgi:AcrR family transcriptional regulator
MSSEERRADILLAAHAVFGARGYEGATTDEVARAAGVSQPYVVRLFGTKESLFLAVLHDALERLLEGFRAELASTHSDAPVQERMGAAYLELLQVRGLHQTLSHAFLLGGHPVIGPAAREGFVRVWRFLRDEAGFDPDTAQSFLAEGMLINTMIGLRLIDHVDADGGIRELFETCFPTTMRAVRDVAPRGDEPW